MGKVMKTLVALVMTMAMAVSGIVFTANETKAVDESLSDLKVYTKDCSYGGNDKANWELKSFSLKNGVYFYTSDIEATPVSFIPSHIAFQYGRKSEDDSYYFTSKAGKNVKLVSIANEDICTAEEVDGSVKVTATKNTVLGSTTVKIKYENELGTVEFPVTKSLAPAYMEADDVTIGAKTDSLVNRGTEYRSLYTKSINAKGISRKDLYINNKTNFMDNIYLDPDIFTVTSGKSSVCSVNEDCEITGVSSGDATINVKLKDGFNGMQTKVRSGYTKNGKQQFLNCLNDGVLDENITYDINKCVFEEVEDGVQPATQNITYPVNFSFKVHVVDLVDSLAFEAGQYETSVGETINIQPIAEPSDKELNTKYTWESTVPDVATVDSKTGEVTAKKWGYTTIKATTTDGTNLVATYKLNVKAAAPTNVRAINLGNAIKVTWDEKENTEDYIVTKQDITKGDDGEIEEIDVKGLKYVDDEVEYGHKYEYTVKTVPSDAHYVSNASKTQIKFNVPAPVISSIEKVNDNTVNVTIEGVYCSQYELFYTDDESPDATSGYTRKIDATNLDPDDDGICKQVVSIGLPETGEYFFKVKAITKFDDKTTGESAFSKVKSIVIEKSEVTTTAAPTTTAAATTTQNIAPTNKKVDVSAKGKKLSIKVNGKAYKLSKKSAKKIKLKSSKKKILSISNKGILKAKKKGKAIISFVYDGKKYQIKAVVKKKGKKFKVTLTFEGKKYTLTLKK